MLLFFRDFIKMIQRVFKVATDMNVPEAIDNVGVGIHKMTLYHHLKTSERKKKEQSSQKQNNSEQRYRSLVWCGFQDLMTGRPFSYMRCTFPLSPYSVE